MGTLEKQHEFEEEMDFPAHSRVGHSKVFESENMILTKNEIFWLSSNRLQRYWMRGKNWAVRQKTVRQKRARRNFWSLQKNNPF
jgi:hypothetical protein